MTTPFYGIFHCPVRSFHLRSKTVRDRCAALVSIVNDLVGGKGLTRRNDIQCFNRYVQWLIEHIDSSIGNIICKQRPVIWLVKPHLPLEQGQNRKLTYTHSRTHRTALGHSRRAGRGNDPRQHQVSALVLWCWFHITHSAMSLWIPPVQPCWSDRLPRR